MHSLLLLAAKSTPQGTPVPTQPEPPTTVQIIDKPDNREATLTKPRDDKGDILAPRPIPKTAECTDGFGGIGVEYSSTDGTIARVYRGYPADRGGIRTGDRLIAPSIYEVRGTPGSKIDIIFERNGLSYSLRLTRELICTENIK
jgi:C-terminal processing protease CtpA/Prc